MAMRSDEVHPSLLSNFVNPFPDSSPASTADDTQVRPVRYLRSLVKLSLHLEDALLQYRRDVRSGDFGSSAMWASFHDQVERLLSLESDLSPFEPARQQRQGSDHVAAIQTATLVIMKLAFCLELYCRYVTLAKGRDTALPMLSMASIARDIVQAAVGFGSHTLNRCGPIIVRHLISYAASQLLTTALTVLAD